MFFSSDYSHVPTEHLNYSEIEGLNFKFVSHFNSFKFKWSHVANDERV